MPCGSWLYKCLRGHLFTCFFFCHVSFLSFYLRKQADPEKALDLGISIENFTYCDNIRISRRMSLVEHPIIHVELQDTKRRSLILNVKVSVKPGGSLRVSNDTPGKINLSLNDSRSEAVLILYFIILGCI